MRQVYKVVNLDSKLGNGAQAEFEGDPQVERALAKVKYSPILTNWPQSRSEKLFISADKYNQRLSDIYWSMAEQAHLISPCGQFQFEHIWCAGRDGLRVDVENGVVFIGMSLNWSEDYFRWWIENSDVGFENWVGKMVFVGDFGEPEIRDDDIVMMKGPGYNIFGHWLLDYIPQAMLTKAMQLPANTKYVFDGITEWMQPLLDAVGVQNVAAYQCRLSEHRNLTMPTSLNNGYAIAQPINMVTWNNLRMHFNHLSVGRDHPSPERVFLSRSNWGGQRSVVNRETVDSVMQHLGFTIFHPEKHTLTDQARMLADARFVVGEDGSALHSIMFTRPGARLGVLMRPDRMNLWHAGICDAMNHGLAYMEMSEDAGEPHVDLNNLRAFVTSLMEA